VLTRLLRDLERDGLVRRMFYAEVPTRIEYSLTPLGGTMCSVVHAVRHWAEEVAPEIALAREALRRGSGEGGSALSVGDAEPAARVVPA
jgi:DNA-binding HxlR family transcriptional regulator